MASTIKTNWKDVISAHQGIDEIIKYVKESGNKICPTEDKIFRCFNYFNWENTKIVILGQDPYHTPGQATGLAFECNSEKIQPSLKNMMKVLGKNEINFEEWAKKGVLLLNTALTTVEGKAGAHMKEWKPFTKSIIKFLNENVKNVLFVCWGMPAYEICKDCSNILVSSHPSPLGASKSLKIGAPSFLESDIFTKIKDKTGIEL